ncbi:MAG: hypothetical protein Q4A54_09125, partial [Parabacteroides sp.]|nr:hypothetical protein [Parabacteroides sp.]
YTLLGSLSSHCPIPSDTDIPQSLVLLYLLLNAIRLSPPTPINAKIPTGNAVRHKTIVFLAKERAVIFSITRWTASLRI